MAKKRTRPRVPEFSEEKKQRFRRRQILLGSFLILLGFLLTVSFISFLFHNQSDQSTLEVFFEKEIPSKNLLNKVGASVSHFFIYQLFGIATFLLPYLMGYTGYLLFLDRYKKQLLNHCSCAFLYLMYLSVFFGFYHMDGPFLRGLVGFEIIIFLVTYLVTFGVVALLLFSFIVILLF